MKKLITISSFTGFCSRGSEALLLTRIRSIRKLFPSVNFCVLTVYTENKKRIKGVEYINTFGGRREKFYSPIYLIDSLIKAFWWTFNIFLFHFFSFCWEKNIKKMARSDLFISSDGDVLGESYGFLPFLWRSYFLSFGFFLKKPVIIYAEGVGPFKSLFGRVLAKLIFKKCCYISVRDKISLENLVELGFDREKIDVVADSAFLLEPSSKNLNFRKKGRRVIGISVSRLVSSYGFREKKGIASYTLFINFFSQLIDWLIEDKNAYIVMVPHAIQPKRDDYQTSLEIFSKIKNKKMVKILNKRYRADEFKKVISYCDLLIAARLHAAIAGLSTGVPVIGIAYSHKMNGVFGQLGMEDFVVDIRNLNWDIKKKIDYVLKNQRFIKLRLNKKIKEIKKLAMKPAYKVAVFLRKKDEIE